jgi:chromosome segregation ATPase
MIFVQEDLTRTKTELAKAREEASKLKAQLQAAVKVSKENDKTAAKTGARIQSLETEKSQLAAAVQGKNIEIKAQADRTVKMEAEIRDLKQQLQQQAEALQREKARVQARSTLHRKQRQWEEDVDYDDEDDDELFVSSQQARKKSRLSLGKAGQPSWRPRSSNKLPMPSSALSPPACSPASPPAQAMSSRCLIMSCTSTSP